MLLYGFSIRRAKPVITGDNIDIDEATVWYREKKAAVINRINGVISIKYKSDKAREEFHTAAEKYVNACPQGAELIHKIKGEQPGREAEMAENIICEDLIFLYLLQEKAKKAWEAGYQYLGIFKKYRHLGEEMYYYAINKDQLKEMKNHYPREVCLLTPESFIIGEGNEVDE